MKIYYIEEILNKFWIDEEDINKRYFYNLSEKNDEYIISFLKLQERILHNDDINKICEEILCL